MGRERLVDLLGGQQSCCSCYDVVDGNSSAFVSDTADCCPGSKLDLPSPNFQVPSWCPNYGVCGQLLVP